MYPEDELDSDDGEDDDWLPKLDDEDYGILSRAKLRSVRVPGRRAMRFRRTVLLTLGLLVVLSVILICTMMEEWGLVHRLGCALGYGGWTYHPVEDGHCNVVRMDVPLGGSYECLPLMIVPSAAICIHDLPSDYLISAAIKAGELWEPHIVAAVVKVLDSDPHMGLIDVGSNIGEYSLVAATRGHPVVAVDVHIQHVRMLQRSAFLNNFNANFTIVYNAVSDSHRIVALQFSKDNQGATRVIEDSHTHSSTMRRRPASGCLPVAAAGHVDTILMDDLLEVVTFSRAVLKIDIEGHEPRSLPYAERLLRKVDVPVIFMEWEVMRIKTNEYEVKDIGELLDFLQTHSYEPFAMDNNKLNLTSWRHWPYDIIWRKPSYNVN